MEFPVHNTAGEKVGAVELSPAIFEANVNRDLMHQALVRQMANARQGTHKAKSRGEVNFTTAKIYRQKGTGNARHGSRRAPIFVGGGVAHGPSPRDYSKRMPKKMHRAALRSALTAKVNSEDFIVLDQIEIDEPKTKAMVAVQERLVEGQSTLLLLANRNENVERSARNVSSLKTLQATYLNIRDLLGYRKLIVPMDALEVLNDFLSEERA
jgi:large subunit ribosomal protein L4